MDPVVEDVVAFCRLFVAIERDAVCCGSVSVAQCVVLQALLDGEWDNSTLAETTRVTKSAMTRLIDGLVGKGFVARRPAADDGRRVLVELTKKGRAEAQRLARSTETAVEAVMERIPAAERKNVVRAIRVLRQATDDAEDVLRCG